jgi:3-oxoacyl-(acyl-carrier-protein) synthase
MASPLLFPETVFAALASHIGALLGKTPLATSIVGDPACFLQGVATAAAWLDERRVDFCLVIGAEESHWLLADALHHYHHSVVISSGAGALCLATDEARSLGVELRAITDAHTFLHAGSSLAGEYFATRAAAARAMRFQLPVGAVDELLCDGAMDPPCADSAELLAWEKWPGQKLGVKRLLGEGLAAATAWQCVAACDALAQGRVPAAMVSLVGLNQQAIGARFTRPD